MKNPLGPPRVIFIFTGAGIGVIAVALLLVFAVGEIAKAGAAIAAAETLIAPWKDQDIGAAEVKGSASLDKNVFTLKGTMDTWGTNDGFHFVWRPLRGDGQIVARVLTVENTMNHAKAGVMFRESLAADSKHAEACVTPVDGTQFLARAETGGKTTSTHTGLDKGKLPYWVKLVRAGDQFSGYESADGSHWSLIGSTNLVMKTDACVGLVTSSHQKTILCTATLDNVTVEASR
jgi:regulation of enolase protein 1 (concanavalin A-like superfamily)